MDEERRRRRQVMTIIAIISLLEFYLQLMTLILDITNQDTPSIISAIRMLPSSHITITDYLDTVNRFTDTQFQENFRLTRSSYEHLETIIGTYCQQHFLRGRAQVNLRTQILSTIWLLGTPDSYRSISERFGIHKGVLYKCALRIVKILCQMSGGIIKWPTEVEQNRIKRQFLRYGMPGVIGAVDGTFIFCSEPKHHGNAYNTRKCQAAIQLQGICKPNLQFTDIFTGYPGSVGDYRIFRNSYIYRDITENPSEFFHSDSHILGDKAYPLKTWCITPYRDNGRLNQEQRQFNSVHSSTRVKIENAFSLLKGRFRRLKKMEIIRHDLAPYYILACCVLHNLCIDIGGEDILRYMADGAVSGDQNQEENFNNDIAPQEATAAAISKRNYLCSYVNQ